MNTIHSKIAGVSRGNRQELIRDSLTSGDPLFLQREYENPADENAIAVMDYVDNKIGYLQSDLAADLASILDDGRDIDCKISEITGYDKGMLGVNIELTVLSTEETRERYKNRQSSSSPMKPINPSLSPDSQKTSNKSAGKRVRKSKKSYVAMVIWFILLGLFGAHRYYAGRGNLIYSFTLGFFMIGYFIDLIQIVTRTFKDGHGYVI